MENKENKVKSVRTTPEYFGSYLNMARHNVFLLINHLTKTFNYLPFQLLKDDSWISVVENNLLLNIFDSSKREFEDDRHKVYNYIIKRHHFPVIKYLGLSDDQLVDFDKVHNFLLLAFTELNNYRNEYTHYLSIDNHGNKLARKLDIDDKLKSNINDLFTHAPEISYLRKSETQTKEDYEHILSQYRLFDEHKMFTEQGLYFFINLFLERKYAIKLLKKIRGFKNETTPTFKGTLQAFTSYCIKIPDTRLGNEFPKHSLLMEMLSELNKCPKELFNHLTTQDKEKFEPKMDEERQNNVRLNSINYENIEDEDIESIVKELISLKRYEDRFPYFALRFIEDTNSFKQINFQITLGKLIIKRYDKTIIGISQDRRVLKTINAFGKLSDFIDKEDEVLSELKKELQDENIAFEQYAPHYNISGNKIGFKIFDKEVDRKQLPLVFENKKENPTIQNNPSGFISIHDLHKIILLNLVDSTIPAEGKIIDFIDNTNANILDIKILDEIKAMTQYDQESFTKKTMNDKKTLKLTSLGDEFIKNYLNLDKENFTNQLNQCSDQQKKDFAINKDVSTLLIKQTLIENHSKERYKILLKQRVKILQDNLPQDILVNQLPEKIKDYLLNISESNAEKKVHLKIRAILKDTELLLKDAKKEPQEGEIIKLGKYATYIARDILNMIIDKDVKQKVTQPYYNKIQNKISYFSINKEELIAILKELDIFDFNSGHVFLREFHITNSKGLKDFYKNYLEQKIKWINRKLFEKGKAGGYRLNNPSVKLPYSFTVIQKEAEAVDFEKWLNNKSMMPVNIPNSLFDQSANDILKVILKNTGTDFKETDTLSVLLRKICSKDTQPFYSYDRVYRDSNKEPITIKQLSGLQSKTIKAKYGSFAEANEKLIRFYQTKDRVVKLMCDFLLNEDQNLADEKGFLLKNIYPNSEISILNHPAKFKHSLKKEGKSTDILFNVIAEDSPEQIAQVENWKKLDIEHRKIWTDIQTREEQQAFLENCTPEERKLYNGQKGFQWKFKDYGRFRRFLKDKRLVGLSEYFEVKEIPFEFLEYQMMEYDRVRDKVFELVFMLEKAIFEKDPNGIINIEMQERSGKKKTFDQVEFKTYLRWLEEKQIYFSKDIIQWGRNKFSHSQFPKFENIQKITDEEIANFNYYKDVFAGKSNIDISIAEKIIKKFESEINRIVSTI